MSSPCRMGEPPGPPWAGYGHTLLMLPGRDLQIACMQKGDKDSAYLYTEK